MAPMPQILHGSDIITCTLSEGKPCALCSQYIDLDSEVVEARLRALEAEKALQEAEERRRVFRSTINNQHDQVTSRLPAEIVAEIFKATLRRKLESGLKDHIIDSPLYLGAVCRSWRRIAWSTPSLWNWMHVFLVRPENKHLEETVKEWLERSGQLPLTIQITSGKGVVGAVDSSLFLPKTGIFGDFVAHINACSTRWRNVSFTAPSTTTDYLNGSIDGTPNLRVLRINVIDGPDHHFWFVKPSRPQSLTMGQHSDPMAWDEMNIVWDNLTEINFSKVTVPLCIDAIKEMPRLRLCILLCDGEDGDNLDDAPEEPFIHPNLEIFKYRTKKTWPFSVHHIFDHFVFPNLTKLSIVSDFHPEGTIGFADGREWVPLTVWEESVMPFIVKSCSKLRTLELQIRCEYLSLVEVLKEAPKLTRLIVTDASGYDRFDFHSFLLRLANTPPNLVQEADSRPEFLGALKFLMVSGFINVENEGISAFEAILGACGRSMDFQKPPRHPIKRMLVIPNNYADIEMTDEKFIPRMSQLIEAGVNLDVRDPKGQKVKVLI